MSLVCCVSTYIYIGFRLTAFVAKVLGQSREFGLDEDPSNVVCSAVKWLTRKQQQNGAFTPERIFTCNVCSYLLTYHFCA